jgi:glycosyltransferase involved in cell wall biosynthesis
MRILVYLHRLTIGGIQINAIDLATAMRDLGHEVIVASTPGPLVSVLEERGLAYVPTPIRGHFRPAPDAIRAISSIVRRQAVDLVHAHSAFGSLEAFYGAHVRARAPMIASFMGMTYPRYLPKTIPLVVGTREVEAFARKVRSGRVVLMEPPVDTAANHPAVDGLDFRRSNGLESGDRAIVIVSRLAMHMKLESLLRSIDAAALLAGAFPVRLLVVGGGAALPILQERAAAANARVGRDVVTFTGHLVDPRPAYAAADVVVGMGSSLLRGMAFGKPAVVIGERGFSEAVTPSTLPLFLRHGFYGVGDGTTSEDVLSHSLRALLQDGDLREDLGRFSRRVICERFSLETAAGSLRQLYEESVREPVSPPALAADALATTGRVLGHKAGRARRLLSRSARPGHDTEPGSAMAGAGDGRR